MTILSTFVRTSLAAAVVATTAAPALAAGDQDASPRAHRDCFYSSQWRGWKSPSPNVIYIGVNNRDVYRVDLSAGSSRLKWSDSYLISVVRGSNWVCGPLDLDLKVSDSSGFATGLIARSMVKLTPEQVAAIPKQYRP